MEEEEEEAKEHRGPVTPVTRSLAREQTARDVEEATREDKAKEEAAQEEEKKKPLTLFTIVASICCCLPRCLCTALMSISCDEQTCMLYSRLQFWEGCAGLWTKLILFAANLFATFPWCLGFHVVRIYVGPWAYYTLEALWYLAVRLSMRTKVVKPYHDEAFPATDESLGDLDETVLTEPIAWKRWGAQPDLGGATTTTGKKRHSKAKRGKLFEDGVDMSDVCQGRLENCWLLSAVACLCQFEGAIQNLFIDKQANPRGCYRLRLYDARLGRWRRITVDDRVPVRERTGAPVFSRPHGHELWVLLLEKAMAKHCGSYAAIEKGDIVWAFEAMTGDAVASYDQVLSVDGDFVWDHLDVRHIAATSSGTSTTEQQINMRAIALKRKGRTFSRDDMFDLVRAYDRHGAALGAGSREAQSGSRVTRRKSEYRYGIVPDHAYSIVSADVYAGVRLVRLRNPWGTAGAPSHDSDDPNLFLRRSFVWRGAWSKGSKEWDENPAVLHAVRAREAEDRLGPLAHVLKLRGDSSSSSSSSSKNDDVTFYLSWDDFCKNFNVIDVCVRTRGMNEFVLTVHEEFGIFGPTVGCLKGLAYFLLLCCGLYKMWCGLIGTDSVIESIEDSVVKDDLTLADKLYSVWFGGAAPQDVLERARQTYRLARPVSTSADDVVSSTTSSTRVAKSSSENNRGSSSTLGPSSLATTSSSSSFDAAAPRDTGLPLPRTSDDFGYRRPSRGAADEKKDDLAEPSGPSSSSSKSNKQPPVVREDPPEEDIVEVIVDQPLPGEADT